MPHQRKKHATPDNRHAGTPGRRRVHRKRCVHMRWLPVAVPAWWRVSAGSPRPCGSRWPGWPRQCSRCTPCTGTSRTWAAGTFRRSRRSSRGGQSSGTRTMTWRKQRHKQGVGTGSRTLFEPHNLFGKRWHPMGRDGAVFLFYTIYVNIYCNVNTTHLSTKRVCELLIMYPPQDCGECDMMRHQACPYDTSTTRITEESSALALCLSVCLPLSISQPLSLYVSMSLSIHPLLNVNVW